jgi:DUF4097 and DUF4098 domain-containing protein YvlB
MKRFLMMASVVLLTVAVSAQKQVKQSFNDITELSVNGIFCDVNIDVASQDKVDFEGQLSPLDIPEGYKILYKQNGTQLKVWVEMPNRNNSGVSGVLTFKIPRNTNVNVENISGEVTAKGLAGTSLVLKSVSGDVDLQNIQSNLKSETVSGNLLINDVSGNLQASSVSGRLEVTKVGGWLNAGSVSGDVKIRHVSGEAKVNSVSGSIDVANASSNVSASCTSGNIVIASVKGSVSCNNISGGIELSAINGSIKAKSLSGGINGEAIQLTGDSWFNSMSGNVNVEVLNADSALSFDLKSFSGRMEAKGISAKEKLKIDKGAIWVHGESFSGNQVYK